MLGLCLVSWQKLAVPTLAQNLLCEGCPKSSSRLWAKPQRHGEIWITTTGTCEETREEYHSNLKVSRFLPSQTVFIRKLGRSSPVDEEMQSLAADDTPPRCTILLASSVTSTLFQPG